MYREPVTMQQPARQQRSFASVCASRARTATARRAIYRPTQLQILPDRYCSDGEDDNDNDGVALEQLLDEQRARIAALEARVGVLEQSHTDLLVANTAIAHDLRGPLQIILGNLGMVRQYHSHEFDSEANEMLQQAARSGLALREMLSGLLDLARADHTALQQTAVDLSALANRIVAELRSAHPERCVRWECAPGMRVTGDRRMLSSLVQNLLSNAWKYTAQRECAAVRFLVRAAVNEELIFCVQDNGVGLTDIDSVAIFSPFFRLPEHEEFTGAGIGLAVVERIVRRHGGRIWAERTGTQGVTFCFTLGTLL